MKWFLLAAYLIVFTNIFPQDSTFQFQPKWVKGESKNIEAVYTQEYFGAFPTSFKMTTSVLFTVYDVIEDTFFVKWEIKDIKLQSDSSSEMFMQSNSMAQELKNITYDMKLDKKGEFISLINSDEIVNRTIDVAINTMKGNGFPIDSTNIANLRNNYWLLEAKVNAECKRLLSPLTCAYNEEFPINGSLIKKYTEKLESDSISIIHKTTLLDHSGDYFTYEILPELDSSELRKILHKSVNTEESSGSNIFMDTEMLIKLNRNDGWIYYVKTIVNAGTGDNKFNEITEYTLQ